MCQPGHALNQSSGKFGFTLIELLVASTIMIVLTAIGLVSFSSSAKSARNSKRKADMETVRQALVLYRSDTGGYPVTTSYNTATDTLITQGYLSAPRPSDPKSGYSYTYNGDGTGKFCLCAQTEGNQGNSSTAATSSTCNYDSDVYYCVSNP